MWDMEGICICSECGYARTMLGLGGELIDLVNSRSISSCITSSHAGRRVNGRDV